MSACNSIYSQSFTDARSTKKDNVTLVSLTKAIKFHWTYSKYQVLWFEYTLKRQSEMILETPDGYLTFPVFV